MIIVYMFQIGTILFEQDQQICIIAYEMLWYLCIFDTDRSSRRNDPSQSILGKYSQSISRLVCRMPYHRRQKWNLEAFPPHLVELQLSLENVK